MAFAVGARGAASAQRLLGSRGWKKRIAHKEFCLLVKPRRLRHSAQFSYSRQGIPVGLSIGEKLFEAGTTQMTAARQDRAHDGAPGDCPSKAEARGDYVLPRAKIGRTTAPPATAHQELKPEAITYCRAPR